MILPSCPTIFMPSSKFVAVGAYRIRPTTAYRIRPTTAYRIRPTTAYRIRPTTAYRRRPTTAYRIRPTVYRTRAYAIPTRAYAIRPYGHRPKRWVPLCGDSNPPCLKKSDFRCGNVITTNILSVIFVVLKKSQTISVIILHVGTWTDSTNKKKTDSLATRPSV